MFSAERAHYLAMNILRLGCSLPGIRSLITVHPKESPVTVWGLRFRHHVGLGAGFDKNAAYLRELHALGFAFVEIGTVTPRPQEGNPKPRLFRLPPDKALINRMGFNNDGVDRIASRLKAYRNTKESQDGKMLIGGNIGKNKSTPNEEAWKDYEICFRALHPYVDFFVVNVSSPNTPGLRALQEKEALREILVKLQNMNAQLPTKRPILLKLAPDLGQDQIDDVAQLAQEIHLDGIVAANTTISREGLVTKGVEEMGAGGLSGAPLRTRANEMMNYLSRLTNNSIPLIGSGGIFTASDVTERLSAGASLVEVWTGFIYEGPKIVKKITG